MGTPSPQSTIFCFGDFPEILRFQLSQLRWEKIRYDQKESAYSGNMRYTSGCVTINGLIYITGGSLVSSGEAVNSVFESRVNAPGRFIRKKNMLNKRYAHACVNLNGYIYCLGGFDNRDADGVAPNTLDYCERFSVHENKWSHMCSMNEARAFAGVSTVGDQFIYLFGGFHDYDVLQSIEKHDAVLDTWVTLYVKLPVPLAKLGVCPTDGGR
jgi:N-acetylneuraminic acid mutarotase